MQGSILFRTDMVSSRLLPDVHQRTLLFLLDRWPTDATFLVRHCHVVWASCLRIDVGDRVDCAWPRDRFIGGIQNHGRRCVCIPQSARKFFRRVAVGGIRIESRRMGTGALCSRSLDSRHTQKLPWLDGSLRNLLRCKCDVASGRGRLNRRLHLHGMAHQSGDRVF